MSSDAQRVTSRERISGRPHRRRSGLSASPSTAASTHNTPGAGSKKSPAWRVAARQPSPIAPQCAMSAIKLDRQGGLVNGSVRSPQSRWISIPPSMSGGQHPRVDLYPAAGWVTLSPPLKA